ncbi:MAG: glycosyltransferase family 2 protein [Candidatus Micrarchaeaceae archaeon]
MSVLIPAYNPETTIQATLDSVLAQTRQADEIFVMDDGSTDNTASILKRYEPRITVFRQSNKGVASARNELVARASGDLIAFLDSDDVWHPSYLEVQGRMYQQHPNAVAFFTGHLQFYGYGDCEWADHAVEAKNEPEILHAPDFLERYHKYPLCFTSPSFCCIPKSVLRKIEAIDGAPFRAELSGADDFYLLHMLPLLGPIMYTPSLLAAYRVTNDTLSAQRLMVIAQAVHAMELIKHRYCGLREEKLSTLFSLLLASKRREYSRVLMGAGDPHEARKQLRYSLRSVSNPLSLAKSLVWLFLTHMPGFLQPTWPLPYNRSRAPAH